MSKRPSLRPLHLLDYRTLNKSGDRVYKGKRNICEMSVPKNQDIERKLSSKIKRFLDENVVSEFFDIEEIEGSAGSLRELLESYEDLHMELRNELGDSDYGDTYKHYDDTMPKIS